MLRKQVVMRNKQEKLAMSLHIYEHKLIFFFIIMNIVTTYCLLECGTLKARQTIWNQQLSVHIFNTSWLCM